MHTAAEAVIIGIATGRERSGVTKPQRACSPAGMDSPRFAAFKQRALHARGPRSQLQEGGGALPPSLVDELMDDTPLEEEDGSSSTANGTSAAATSATDAATEAASRRPPRVGPQFQAYVPPLPVAACGGGAAAAGPSSNGSRRWCKPNGACWPRGW